MSQTHLTRRGALGVGASGLAFTVLVACGGTNAEAAGRFEVERTPAEWKKRLGAARYRILREAGTEAPFSSSLNKEKRKGVFACAGCALPLFSSATKYDSGTGWPSFWQALPKAVAYRRDGAFGMSRTEEHCRRCGGHLGHVFDDGPKPTGKRHCINGLSLVFKPSA